MHIQFAELPVFDQDRAKAFYTKYFDLEVRSDTPMNDEGWRWIELVPRGEHTSLHFTRRENNRASQGPVISLVDLDVRNTHARLADAGVEIISPPQSAPWDDTQLTAAFRDSEGNEVVLTSPGEARERSRVRTCLWFEEGAEEAARFYTDLLPGEIDAVSRATHDGPAQVVALSLMGTPYTFLNGGPQHKLSPAVSITVETDNQQETDRLWNALLSGGGQPGHCGWLEDRFGVSWQITPRALFRMLGDADREAAGRAMEAMLQMSKIEVATLEAAFRGDGHE